MVNKTIGVDDFNINLVDTHSLNVINFYSVLETFILVQLIDEPAGVTDSTPS